MLLTRSKAAKEIGVTKQYLQKLLNQNPRPSFFVDSGKKIMVDTDCEEWKVKVKNFNILGDKSGIKIDPVSAADQSFKTVLSSEKKDDTISDAVVNANMLGLIAMSKIKQERAKQEEIKTAQLKKELAPISLIVYFFSFAENMIQRNFRRFEEISPDLEAYFLAGKSKEAIKLLQREEELIVSGCVDELKKNIKGEGYGKK